MMTTLIRQDLGSLSGVVRDIAEEVASQIRDELLQVPINVASPTVNVAAPAVNVEAPDLTVESSIPGLAELTTELRTVAGLLRDLLMTAKAPVTADVNRGVGGLIESITTRR